MSDNKNNYNSLDAISLEFALHVPHMMQARERFEDDMKIFQNNIVIKINDIFMEENINTLGFSIEHDLKKSKTTGSCIMTSFNNEQIFNLYYRETNKHKNKSIGHVHSRILFDDSRQNFAWKFYFTNSDLWDDQIDERCRQIVDSMDKDYSKVLTNHRSYESNVYSFFMIPLTEKFRPNDLEVLDISTNTLVEAMVQSKKFKSTKKFTIEVPQTLKILTEEMEIPEIPEIAKISKAS